jgi:hypothetical protein
MHVQSLMMMVKKYLKATVEGAWNMEMNVSDPIITQVTVSTNHL